MNKVLLTGRLTQDPELKKVNGDISVCQFSLAVDKRFKKSQDEKPYFFNCVAWRVQADFICNYCHQGDKILIDGYLTSRTWEDNNGQKRFATEVYVDNVEFLRAKGDGNQSFRNPNNLEIPEERKSNGNSFGNQLNNEPEDSKEDFDDIFMNIKNKISDDDLPVL